MATALVTGSAGFIGDRLCRRLLNDGFSVVGLDARSDCHDPALKRKRHEMLMDERFTSVIGRVETPGLLRGLFERHQPDHVVHLAAQAGVL